MARMSPLDRDLASAHPYRSIPLGPRGVLGETRGDGSLILRSPEPLGAYPDKLTDHLEDAARRVPDRVFLAVREPAGDARRWRELSYGQAWQDVQRIAGALLARGLSPERPVAILSGSGIEHALLGLAAMHVGIPYAAITPAYSLLSDDHAKLRHVLGLLKPGLVFADDAAAFETAIGRSLTPDVEVVHSTRPLRHRASTAFASLLAGDADSGDAVRRASRAVQPDAPAKVLFTSGSTGMPKGVINTHRMVACNQQMFVQALPAIEQSPPVIVSWLPWHHTSGGNQMMGLTLRCAGTFHVDDGKPVPGEVERTVDNLREIAPTVYFSVPRGFAMLIPYLREDAALRERFFSRLSFIYYSGSALGASLVRDLDELAVLACGERIPMMSGYGATESSPFALAQNWLTCETGLAGLPMPGCELKLHPLGGGKFEARLRGPNITPGYWGQPEFTARLFDEEGFARLGDALSLVDPDRLEAGLTFDGRIVEDFKLATGTFVSVGRLRGQWVQAGDGLFLDAVIAGEGRDDVAAFIVGDRVACTAFCALAPDAPWERVLSHPALRARVQQILDQLAERGTGSSTFAARAIVLRDPPDGAAGELTDKGSINQRTFLANRPELLAAAYADPAPPDVYRAAMRKPG
jgi:feruloyl-CoA synthase